MFHIAKLRIFSGICVTILLQKYFEVVDTEDTAVTDFAALAGGKNFYVPPAAVETVSQRDAVTEFEDRAVGFPYGNIDRVAGVEHGASGRYVYRTSHYEKVGLNLSLKMPGVVGMSTTGVLSAKRQVNFTLLSFSSVSENSQV